MSMEASFILKNKFYSSSQPVRSILDVEDRERIEAEYVNILRTLIERTGCDSVLVRSFTDYRGRYLPEHRAKILKGLRKLLLVSGMKLDVQEELDAVLKMSFRKLISVNLVVCDKLEIRTYDDGIGAIVVTENGMTPDINSTSGFFEVNTN